MYLVFCKANNISQHFSSSIQNIFIYLNPIRIFFTPSFSTENHVLYWKLKISFRSLFQGANQIYNTSHLNLLLDIYLILMEKTSRIKLVWLRLKWL